jgi:hypothetical protein
VRQEEAFRHLRVAPCRWPFARGEGAEACWCSVVCGVAVGFTEFMVLELLRLEMADVKTLIKIHDKFSKLDSDHDGVLSDRDVKNAFCTEPLQ